ncbi:helix-turn-helix domain-containing protein [Herbiconiux sp. CPCC 203407]|uniref:DNA-3-methyladenine glycosylase II n=1 Tax=Herbiconiux oxytropis TaxID=2970915 RepID=A0AA41XDZ0_9MICO|nr:AlkA N-terminal domain-containing protein [Herbiconiux oxytropis]MCS5723517.1 helix-turn-helix domain-containing protein [Herbiconiux oxytropis]MCS5726436.1 helix-turn-helix domain-containing protein [Herbiconiux oxytropis]
MDFDSRYRIIQSRDARFDGQFITAVSSTGIYCRPSCPARTPKPGNVTFYATSAAAHEAGYRACKRCLPEAVPGTPDWNLRHDLTARAMRLIGDGVVEREGVDGLASQLGYSPRHLTRVLRQELGAGPLALARAHRAQTARTLLTSTDLPMADIAYAAGFRSIRQFNETIAEVFRLTPSEVRARPSHRAPASASGTAASTTGPAAAAPGATPAPATPSALTLALPYREPFDAAGVFTWLAARAVPGIEDAGPAHYSRTLRLPAGPARFTVRHDPGTPGLLHLEAHLTALADLPVLVARVRRLFDLDADPTAIDDALREAAATLGSPALEAHLRELPGIRMPGAVDPDEMLFRAILGQQISVASARTLLRRLAAAAGAPYPHVSSIRGGDGAVGPEPLTLLFPTAAQVAAHAEAVLTGPRAKIRTIVATAEALAEGTLDLSIAADPHDLHARLTALPGIGPWTSGYLAMRLLHHPDILLPGDSALRAGARALALPDTAKALVSWSAPFTPWRTYLSLHLWRASAPLTPTPRRPEPAREPRTHTP